ncbi:Acidic fibroblast growth factor intracellular-binding protein [Hypsibius exemplaris]|uniref:Acidic fibroblast growth factor intracellular-binding protein n=1 Tax=Hypsibius exemplaris TaxID=2072580 RepID=A0A1W0WAI2_HYPEX|nr:Acidic fibroblast growth factor intracellular-binding protein [Hypsibius exemplaris]
MDAVDVFIENRSCLDMDIYQLWLDGEIEEICRLPFLTVQLDDTPSSKQILASYVADQVRTFHLLEKWLHSPAELADQPVFQLTDSCRTYLLEKYYTFDRQFMREILGRKFNKFRRKDFEDECRKTGVKLDSCYRQYENMRRVWKSVSAMDGCTMKNIHETFLLPDQLARDYSCVLFLSAYRMEMASVNLTKLPFDYFVSCAAEMMKGWTCTTQPSGPKGVSETLQANSEGASDLRIDKDFFYSMKEFRFLLERDAFESFRRAIGRNVPIQAALPGNPEIFRDSVRTMLTLALNVHHSKQFRLLFADITDKLLPAWKNAAWRNEDAVAFLNGFIISAEELNEFKSRDARLAGMWKRFFAVFNACVLRLFRTDEKPTVEFVIGQTS